MAGIEESEYSDSFLSIKSSSLGYMPVLPVSSNAVKLPGTEHVFVVVLL